MDKILFDDKTGKVVVMVHVSNPDIIQHNDEGYPSVDVTDHPDKEKIFNNPENYKMVKQGDKFKPQEKTEDEKKADKEKGKKLRPAVLDIDPVVKALQKQVDDLQKEIELLKKKP